MQQWEYMGVRLLPEADRGRIIVTDPASWKGTPLNELGRQGWEVVGVFRDNFWVLLKRPLRAGDSPTLPAQTAAAAVPVAPVETSLAQEAAALYGLPGADREQELERRLQEEMQRRRSGRNPEGGQRR